MSARVCAVAESMITVPGAVGAFRREAVLDVGGLATDTLAEDTDLTIAVTRAGWKVVYADSAVAWTEAPASIRQFWRQRSRWTYGTLQAIWKHRRALIEGGASGKLGRRGIMLTAIFGYALPLTAPVLDVFLIHALIFSHATEILVGTLSVFVVQALIAVAALRLDKESLRPLWLLPLLVFGYRQLIYLNIVHSVVTAAVGSRLHWQRMDRMGTAAATSAPIHPPTIQPASVANE